MRIHDDTVDGCDSSESPVENGGKHPIIYRLSTILLVVFRISLAHPQYDDTVNQKHDRAVEKPTLPKLTKTDQNRP